MLPALLDPMGIFSLSINRSLPVLVILIVWAAVMMFAWAQFEKVRRMTVQMALQVMCTHPYLSDHDLWQIMLPAWTERLAGITLILPNRTHLWVDLATPEHAIEMLHLGPGWLASLRKGRIQVLSTSSR